MVIYMNIVYILDDNYISQVATSLCSLCENNKTAKHITFYVLSLGISDENKEKLTDFVKSYGDEVHTRELNIIEVGRVEDHIDFEFHIEGWKPIVLVRLLLDRFLPESVHRALYLDGDTLVLRNLEHLFATNMGVCTIGAAIEPTCSHKRKEALGLKGFPYYNAGVLLLDMDNWRANDTGREILDYYRERNGRLFANDQDAINGSQKCKIKTISCGYNYHNTYDIYHYRLMAKNCDYNIPSKKTMDNIKKRPAIVHFLGEERPWRAGNTNRFREAYEEYLAKTPWADTPQETGWETYFLCWKVFNTVMKPFPLLRCRIINRLIPVLLHMKEKKKS